METDQEEREHPRLTFLQFLGYYLLVMLVGVLIGVAAILLGQDPVQWALFLYFGSLFVMAGLGRPPLLLEVVRSTGWFALIDSTTVMRVILLVLGALFLYGGISPWLP